MITFRFLALVCFLYLGISLGFSAQTQAQTGAPATIREALGGIEITGILYYRHYERIESHDVDFAAQFGDLPLDVGFTPAWYEGNAPVADYPSHIICIWTGEGSGNDRCDIFIWIYEDSNGEAVVYPAIWSKERMFNADRELRNHPDLGWWSMKREDVVTLLESVGNS